MAAKAKPKARRRGYASGGYIDMPPGPTFGGGTPLSGDSLGRSITSGFTAGLGLAGAMDKKKPDGKPDSPKDKGPTTPPMDRDKDVGWSPMPNEEFARGGKIRRTAGPRIGKDDGLIPAQKGEYVVRKSAVNKLGTKALNTINKGKLPAKGKR